jgi:NAD(P)H-dependent FMN reductase
MKIGIILGSTRPGRVTPEVGKWVLKNALEFGKATYEIVDIEEYDLPFFGNGKEASVKRWQEKVDELDGYIVISGEYNHSMSGALKNAFDCAKKEWSDKAAGLITYGSSGGARAGEHVRAVLSGLNIAHISLQILLSTFLDFEDHTTFKPREIHQRNLEMFFPRLESWVQALNTIRN